MSTLVKNNENKKSLKTYTLSQESIDQIISKLGPYKKMTLQECQEMAAKKLGEEGLSSAIIEERNEGR